MEEKKCFKCKAVRPLSEFYKHPQMKDGRVNKCKSCNKKDNIKNREDKVQYYREYDRNRSSLPHRVDARKEYQESFKKDPSFTEKRRISNKKYREKYPEKAKARRMVNYYIRKGTLKREPCKICGNIKSESHHPDYKYPLNIVWLCDKHHKEEHVRNGSFRKKD
jgi:hypothetical protein